MDERRTIEQFFLGLTICNTVTVNTGQYGESSDDVLANYVGESSDEVALVKGAHAYSFQLLERLSDFIKIRSHDGVETIFNILHVLQFDSERKCMSVIVKNKNDKILLFCK